MESLVYHNFACSATHLLFDVGSWMTLAGTAVKQTPHAQSPRKWKKIRPWVGSEADPGGCFYLTENMQKSLHFRRNFGGGLA